MGLPTSCLKWQQTTQRTQWDPSPLSQQWDPRHPQTCCMLQKSAHNHYLHLSPRTLWKVFRLNFRVYVSLTVSLHGCIYIGCLCWCFFQLEAVVRNWTLGHVGHTVWCGTMTQRPTHAHSSGTAVAKATATALRQKTFVENLACRHNTCFIPWFAIIKLLPYRHYWLFSAVNEMECAK